MGRKKINEAGVVLSALFVCLMIVGFVFSVVYITNPNVKQTVDDVVDDITGDNEVEEEWMLVERFSWNRLGDVRDNGSAASCIEFVMCYEQGNSADFSTNGTIYDPDDGGYNASSIVYGYDHTDAGDEDLDHTVNWDFASLCKLNLSDIGYDTTKFDCSRARLYVNMTNGGSWLDGQDMAGVISEGKVEVLNTSGQTFAYIMFYWFDDAQDDDGYAINPDGSFTWDVTLEVKR